MKAKSQKTPEQWGSELEGKLKTYREYEKKLCTLINDIFKAKRIDTNEVIEGIHSRTKETRSFIEKIKRKCREGKIYSDPTMEMTDLVGIRIVTYYAKDIEKIKNTIRAEFLIDEENTVDKMRPEDSDRFGYASFHFVVSISERRKRLPEWSEYSGFKAEIQLRTVLQHAWASIDHKIRYKTISEAPDDLKRKLFRLSALLELADDEFYNIKIFSDKRNKRISDSLTKGVTDIEIDVDSIRYYLSGNAKEIQKVKSAANQASIRVEDLPYFDKYLLDICKRLNMTRLTMLIAYLHDFGKTKANNALIQLNKHHSYLSLQGIIIFLLICNNAEKIRIEDFAVPKYEKEVFKTFLKAAGEL